MSLWQCVCYTLGNFQLLPSMYAKKGRHCISGIRKEEGKEAESAHKVCHCDDATVMSCLFYVPSTIYTTLAGNCTHKCIKRL